MMLLGTLRYAKLSNIQKLKYPQMADITTFNAARCVMADYVETSTCTTTTCFIMLHRLHG